MKRKTLVALMMAMTLALTACTNAGDAENSTDVPQTEETDDTEDEVTNDSENTEDTENTQDDAVNQEGTTGEILSNDFLSRIEENPDMTAQEMADAILTNSIIAFSGMTMEVEEGLLTGFSAEITGFEQGVMFSPMIGSIPFVGYIFTTPEGADVDAFVETLKSNADPRWNICTEADETVVEASGNTVFFLMCPMSLEE